MSAGPQDFKRVANAFNGLLKLNNPDPVAYACGVTVTDLIPIAVAGGKNTAPKGSIWLQFQDTQ